MDTRALIRLASSIADLPEPAQNVVVEVVAECWRTVENAQTPPDEECLVSDITRRFDTLDWRPDDMLDAALASAGLLREQQPPITTVGMLDRANRRPATIYTPPEDLWCPVCQQRTRHRPDCTALAGGES